MALADVLYLLHVLFLMKHFAPLGYPDNFPNILGVAKVFGRLGLADARILTDQASHGAEGGHVTPSGR